MAASFVPSPEWESGGRLPGSLRGPPAQPATTWRPVPKPGGDLTHLTWSLT
jgi:hypothetical protein